MVFINRVWRGLITAFCFALFGLGSFILAWVWFSLLAVVIPNKQARQQQVRKNISSGFRFFLTTAKFLGVLDYQILGAEKLLEDKGCLILANHPTLIDYVLITAALPRASCIAKAELQTNFFFAKAVKAAGYLINSESESLIEACRERLAMDEPLVIFPEGTRTPIKGQAKLQRGAANLAVRLPSDMRLVRLSCSEPILSKQSKWYSIPPRKPVFTVEVLDKLSPQPFLDAANNIPSLAARSLTKQLTSLLTQPNKT